MTKQTTLRIFCPRFVRKLYCYVISCLIFLQAALDYVVAENVKMNVSCTYIQKYIQDNPLPQYVERIVEPASLFKQLTKKAGKKIVHL